jgi:hypothetical protein
MIKRIDMSTKRWIGTVVITLVVLAVLVGGGFALYRLGYVRGELAAANGSAIGRLAPGMHGRFMAPEGRQGVNPRFENPQGQMPFRNMPYGFGRGFIPGSRLFRFGGPAAIIGVLLGLALLALVVWLIIKIVQLLSGNSKKQLSTQAAAQETTVVEAAAVAPEKTAIRRSSRKSTNK